MNKLATSLVLFLSCFAVNVSAAFEPQNCVDNHVSSPLLPGALSLALSGLYWQAVNTESDYALTGFHSNQRNIFDIQLHDVEPSYKWGFKGEISYQFPCSANDITFTATNYNHNVTNGVSGTDLVSDSLPSGFVTASIPGNISVSGSFFSSGSSVTTGPVFVTIPGAQLGAFLIPIDPTTISANQHFKNSTWDLNFGKKINVGHHLQFHFTTGLRYSQLEHSLETVTIASGSSTAVLNDVVVVGITPSLNFAPPSTLTIFANPTLGFTANVTDTIHQKSKYNGFGPSLGLETTLHLVGGLSITSNISSSLLIGESKHFYLERRDNETTATLEDLSLFVFFNNFVPVDVFDIATAFPTTFSDPSSQESSIHFPNQTRIVPNIDTKIGLEYAFCFPNSLNKLTIEGGYLVSYYFNAIDRFEVKQGINPSNQIIYNTFDTSFNGPYLRVSLTI